jgi:hypothetical protein
MGTAGVGALWGVGFFSTDFVLGELTKLGVDPEKRNSVKNAMFLLQKRGSFFGILTFAVIAERFNRRKAFFLSYVLAWISVLAFFWGVSKAGPNTATAALILAPIMGFCSLMPFSGFTIYFPAITEQAEAPRPETVLMDGPAGKETLLLVEDDPMVRSLAVEALRLKGYRVLDAADGREAIQHAQTAGNVDLLKGAQRDEDFGFGSASDT